MLDRLYQLWQHAVYVLNHATEIQVSQGSDRAGHAYFEIYDPNTGKSNTFGTEQEIRAWLDQTHY
jgi:hypothetical protein